jgi:hypothetical protein
MSCNRQIYFVLSATFNVEANTEIMKEKLSSLSFSSSSSSLATTVADTDCMIARAIVHTNDIGVLNNVKGNKDFDDMIYNMM